MPSEIIDANASTYNSTSPKPHGLLAVPGEVEEFVAREKARLAAYMTVEAEARMRNDLTLQYYFDGIEIAYRITPSGVQVLAVGWDEVKNYLRDTPWAQRKGVLIGQP